MQQKLDQINVLIQQSPNLSPDKKETLLTLIDELKADLTKPNKKSKTFNDSFNKNITFLEKLKSQHPTLVESCDRICAMLYQIGI